MIGVKIIDDGITKSFTPCLSSDMCAADVRDTLQYAARGGHERSISDIEQRARRPLLNAGYDPNRLGDVEFASENGELGDAYLILRRIGIFRSANANGDHEEAIYQAVAIEALASKHDFFVDYGSFIKRGRAFIEGPKQKRQDALARAIGKALAKLGPEATAEKVLNWLRNNNFEIDEDRTVCWTSGRGKEKSTSFKSLEKRLVLLRRRALEN